MISCNDILYVYTTYYDNDHDNHNNNTTTTTTTATTNDTTTNNNDNNINNDDNDNDIDNHCCCIVRPLQRLRQVDLPAHRRADGAGHPERDKQGTSPDEFLVFFLAGSFRKCLSCEVLKGMFPCRASAAPLVLTPFVRNQGIWHTGVVVHNKEYWFGGNIFESEVGHYSYVHISRCWEDCSSFVII